jgi:hypothetical protein
MQMDPSPQNASISGSSRLPVELAHGVINLVYGKQQLYRLCLTSKVLQSAAEPRLYQLHFNSDVLRDRTFHDIIQHPRFETIINTLTITLSAGSSSCDKTSKCCRFCDRVDETVGNALKGLLGLKALRLKCTLCHTHSYERHRWLLTLKTRSLQEFGFRCMCCPIKPAEILAAPCMESVATLEYFHIRPGTQYWEENLEPFPSDPPILPQLRHLCHVGQPVHHSLLRHLPLTRLSTKPIAQYSLDTEDLCDTQGRLTHLSLEFTKDTFQRFLKAMIDNPAPFRNLQHVGTFDLTSKTCSVSLFSLVVSEKFDLFKGTLR